MPAVAVVIVKHLRRFGNHRHRTAHPCGGVLLSSSFIRCASWSASLADLSVRHFIILFVETEMQYQTYAWSIFEFPRMPTRTQVPVSRCAQARIFLSCFASPIDSPQLIIVRRVLKIPFECGYFVQRFCGLIQPGKQSREVLQWAAPFLNLKYLK
jgi:hypothetical protein